MDERRSAAIVQLKTQRREAVGFSDLFGILWRNVVLISMLLLASLFLAAAYLLLTPPTYRAYAQLLLETKPPQLFRNATDVDGDGGQIETHMVALKARGIASAVVSKLDLVNDEEFRGKTGLTPSWTQKLAFWRAENERVAVDAFQNAVNAFQRKTSVEREGMSQVIRLSFSSDEPQKSARITNELARAYIQSLLEVRANAARTAGDWLEERLATLRVQMNEAAQRAKNYRANRESASLEEIQLSADTYRTVYQDFSSALTEAVQRESYPISPIRIISEASVPEGRSKPLPTIVFAFSALIGVGAGFIIAVLRERSRNRTVNK